MSQGSALIPTVEWARRAYDKAVATGSSYAEALELAYYHFGYHVRRSGTPHIFTDAEIRSGACGCDECVPKVEQMRMELREG